MTAQISPAAAWFHALTFSERLASLRVLRPAAGDGLLDADLARRRLNAWRSQSPFADDNYFAQRLDLEGITEDELYQLLGEPIEAVRDRCSTVPQWLVELTTALSQPAVYGNDGILLPQDFCGCRVGGFLNIVAPLIYRGCARLRDSVHVLAQDQPNLPFDSRTIEAILFASLPAQLFSLLSRTLTLELNVARLEGQLTGDTPRARFESFSARLGQRESALAILEDYPVLARQLGIHIDNWLNLSLEFLRHLCADWDAIRAALSPANDPGQLIKLDRAGDSHCSGRAVLVATFSSNFQVVYKPKSMAVDVHFQELLGWLNERGTQAPFRRLQILDRDSYGWSEYATAQSCANVSEVSRFYERQGGYLALLYALEATDFHFENLIAAGEDPVLVDLESLFHPRIEGVDVTENSLTASSKMVHSVLRVGLLPQRMWLNDENEGIDLSGLGATPGQMTPDELPYWEGAGTDKMRLSRKRVALPGAQNRPTLAGSEVNALDYSEAIMGGFTAIYQLLSEHRDELLSEHGPLARFGRDKVRLIVRPTRTYSLVMQAGIHPDMLHSALDQDWLLDRLWIGVKQRPYLVRILPSECDDLRRGDIPIFTTRPDTCDIWNSSGERIADFLDEPGMTLVRRRVEWLSNDDLQKQLWFINASLATLSTGTDQVEWTSYFAAEPKVMADHDQLLEASRAVGDRLEALVLRDGQDVAWLGLSFINEQHWTLLPLGLDLYNGLAGVALFLAYLGAITEEERYTETAQATLSTLQRSIGRLKSAFRSVGAFDGAGGLIYTLTHLSFLWDRPELLAEAEEIVRLLPPLIEQDKVLDIIGGSAGCIGSLITLHKSAPSNLTLETAIACGDKLVDSAQPMERGIGWVTQMGGSKPLAGFSHGTAGIALALLELAALTNEERFKTASINAIAYERSLFSQERGNWEGLQNPKARGSEGSAGKNFILAWCHGAPGIGLARLRSLRYLDDLEIRAEIFAALKITLAQGFGRNHSLCHGDLGNIELLLQAAQTFDDSQWHSQERRITTIILQSIKENGWLCGVPLNVESPSLMTGLAGIGYQLLRLAEPTRIPSVLVLEPPILSRNDSGVGEASRLAQHRA